MDKQFLLEKRATIETNFNELEKQRIDITNEQIKLSGEFRAVSSLIEKLEKDEENNKENKNAKN